MQGQRSEGGGGQGMREVANMPASSPLPESHIDDWTAYIKLLDAKQRQEMESEILLKKKNMLDYREQLNKQREEKSRREVSAKQSQLLHDQRLLQSDLDKYQEELQKKARDRREEIERAHESRRRVMEMRDKEFEEQRLKS